MSTINGKDLAAVVSGDVKVKAQRFLDEVGRKPALHVVLVGQDPASRIYVRNKKRACKRAGIDSVQHLKPASTTQEELLELIARLNVDEQVDCSIRVNTHHISLAQRSDQLQTTWRR